MYDYNTLEFLIGTEKSPEHTVGKPAEIVDKRMDELIDIYEELIAGALVLSCTDSQIAVARCRSTLDWLRTTDFYTAPASTQFHESFPGGLLVHSLRVYNQMISLIKIDVFKSVNLAEATIAALVHDWCKIGYYEAYQRNVKNEKTGQWEKETAYKTNQKGVPLGHGATSAYLATRCFNLSIETVCAIRWHNGEYNVAPNEINELHNANAQYPMCYLLQFSDRIACTPYAQ